MGGTVPLFVVSLRHVLEARAGFPGAGRPFHRYPCFLLYAVRRLLCHQKKKKARAHTHDTGVRYQSRHVLAQSFPNMKIKR